MSKSMRNGETKVMNNGMKIISKGETKMDKKVKKTVAANAEVKTTGETKMDLKTQVKALLSKMPVAERAKTSKGADYNILTVTGDSAKEFWDLWKGHKEDVRSLGIAVFAKAGQFYIRDFTELNYDCSKSAKKERSLKALEKGREVKAKNDKAKRESVAKSLGLPTDINPKELQKITSAMKVLKEAGLLK